MKISIQTDDFDIQAEINALKAKHSDLGALVSFVGCVRDISQESKNVQFLHLEYYPEMAEKVLQNLVDQAFSQWGILDVCLIHRVGKLDLSARIVLVLVGAEHRKPAFLACEFLIDALKTNVPFWKKEISQENEIWVTN